MTKMISLVGFLLSIFLIAMGSKDDLSYNSHYIEVDEVRLHYKKGGQGPYLLLLHGFTLSSEQWSEYFDEFSKSYTVIAFDLPGHGKSERTDKEFNFDHWTELLLKAIDKLGVKQAKAIGHSYGAITLMSIASKQPDLLEALVIISAAHRLDPEMQEILLEDSFEKSSKEVQNYYRKIHNGNMEQIDGIFSDIRAFVKENSRLSTEELSSLKLPVFMIYGERDTYYPLEIISEMRESLSNSQLWVVPEHGHAPVWSSLGADDLIVDHFSKQVIRFFRDSGKTGYGK